jgi:uncharacterized glyoxalase superfamily protein PhnB
MELRRMTVVRHTANFDEMIGFYRDGLGMRNIDEWNRADTDRGAVLAPDGDVGNASIEVLALGDLAVAGVAPVNVVLSLFVDDARAAQEEVTRAGVVIAREFEDTPWGHRSFGVDDPDGLRIWIVQDLETHSAS